MIAEKKRMHQEVLEYTKTSSKSSDKSSKKKPKKEVKKVRNFIHKIKRNLIFFQKLATTTTTCTSKGCQRSK